MSVFELQNKKCPQEKNIHAYISVHIHLYSKTDIS